MAKATLMEDDSPTVPITPREFIRMRRSAHAGPLEIPVTPAEEATAVSTLGVVSLINAT